MGSCKSSQRAITPCNNLECDLDTSEPFEASAIVKNAIRPLVTILDNKLLEKITPTSPITSEEFEKLYRTYTKEICNRYAKQFEPKSGSEKELKIYKISRMYLISKWKSQEGYFRLLNEFYSFQHNYSLKISIIKEFWNRRDNISLIMYEYQKKAKGTYFYQGLQEICKINEFDSRDQMVEFISRNADNMKKELNQSLKEIQDIKAIDSGTKKDTAMIKNSQFSNRFSIFKHIIETFETYSRTDKLI
jgi:hypothetical protein